MYETKTITYEKIRCSGCGVFFAVDSFYIESRREDGKTFYCPNRCNLSYSETEADKLKKKVARLQSQADQKDAAISRRNTEIETLERSRAAIKGQVTKIKNRVGAGVCPCCNKQFQNLARHMDTKHADYSEHKHRDNKKAK